MSFSKWIRTIAIFVCVVVPSVVARAGSPAFDAIYVFGDSYCDVGNVFLATGGTQPLSPPYYFGRFSNGPIWVEHVASAMGLPMHASLAGGTDYAFGGAWVTQPQVTPQGTIPDVPQQVGLYLSQHGGKADGGRVAVAPGGCKEFSDSGRNQHRYIAGGAGQSYLCHGGFGGDEQVPQPAAGPGGISAGDQDPAPADFCAIRCGSGGCNAFWIYEHHDAVREPCYSKCVR